MIIIRKDPTDLVRANRDWLLNEAPYEQRFMHSKMEAASAVWRRLAQERLEARNAANTPW